MFLRPPVVAAKARRHSPYSMSHCSYLSPRFPHNSTVNIRQSGARPGRDLEPVPYTHARHLGHCHVRLTANEALAPHKRHYIFVKVTDDEFEQALALTMLFDPSYLSQRPVIERFLTSCLSCGVTTAREITRSKHCLPSEQGRKNPGHQHVEALSNFWNGDSGLGLGFVFARSIVITASLICLGVWARICSLAFWL